MIAFESRRKKPALFAIYSVDTKKKEVLIENKIGQSNGTGLGGICTLSSATTTFSPESKEHHAAHFDQLSASATATPLIMSLVKLDTLQKCIKGASHRRRTETRFSCDINDGLLRSRSRAVAGAERPCVPLRDKMDRRLLVGMEARGSGRLVIHAYNKQARRRNVFRIAG